ncbi:MAG: hypothetical protein ACYS8Z_10650 [Planctomycetota bacterium]|jgi:7-cyano-7-deazaguanine synthase in queuosine biosynthesis
MRIEVLGIAEEAGLVKAAANVVWEDNDRPSQEVFFGVPEEYGQYLCCNSDAFLVASLLPAANTGERRISIDEDVCPKLEEDLPTVVNLFGQWYDHGLTMPRIETSGKQKWKPNLKARDAGSFLSGGIDSLALLRWNRLRYPAAHSKAIKHCFFVYGFDMGVNSEHDEARERAVTSLSAVAQDAEAKLIPVYTNIKSLNEDLHFWLHQFHGACLAAVGHIVAQRIKSISIAASYHVSEMEPWGSHPLIDSNYSSTELRVEHEGIAHSRMEKTQLIAEWEAGLQNLRVCTQIISALKSASAGLNCGKCEKCIRTMTALVAAGALERTRAFPESDVSKAMLKSVDITHHFPAEQYRELIKPLQSQGRDDLVRAIRRMLLIYRIRKGAARIDEKFCGGILLRIARRLLKKK